MSLVTTTHGSDAELACRSASSTWIGAHHVGGVRAGRIGERAADQGLGSEVEHDLWLAFRDDASLDGRRLANVE